MVKQIAQTSGPSLVVTSFLISKQKAGIPRAAFGGGQSPLGIKQNRAGMWREDFSHQRLELFHHGVGDIAAFFFRQ